MEEGDDKLVSYLLRNKHGTPFEHTYLRWRVEAPIFVFREWHRHRVGWSYNEMSGRYVELPERHYAPEAGEVRSQAGKPGSYLYEVMGDQSDAAIAADIIAEACADSFQHYHRLLRLGVAKEQARCVLPVGTHSQMIASCNARSLMAFLELRTHERAQREIRELALEMLRVFHEVMPVTAQAFEDAGRVAP